MKTDIVLTRTQKLILKSLRKGKAAAISRWDLAERFGMAETQVRKDLRALSKHYPVCGGYGASGYYIACNKNEIIDYNFYLSKHIAGMKFRLNAMRKFL